MNMHRYQLPRFLVAMMALALAFAPAGWADDDDELEIPYDEAEIFFELNHTDGDLGIHAKIDGEAWKSLKIYDPNEVRMLGIWTKRPY